jgi:hypothetical protein
LHADGTFTVQLPYPGGRLDPAEFEQGTAEDYNAALKHARPVRPLP